jgi:hypothetical protein
MIKPINMNDPNNGRYFFINWRWLLSKEGKIRTAENILNSNRWSHVYWPSYDKEKDLIYFVAQDSHDIKSRTNIYRICLLSLDQEPIKLIVNARHPSISPDNNTMAFYRHPNQLWIQRLEGMNEKKVVSDIVNYQYAHLFFQGNGERW